MDDSEYNVDMYWEVNAKLKSCLVKGKRFKSEASSYIEIPANVKRRQREQELREQELKFIRMHECAARI